MGLILDSSVVIAAERRGDNVAQMLKQIVTATGDQRAVLSSIGMTELVHGIYRAQTPEARNRRDSFIRELLNAASGYPHTKNTPPLACQIEAEQRRRRVPMPFATPSIRATTLAGDSRSSAPD